MTAWSVEPIDLARCRVWSLVTLYQASSATVVTSCFFFGRLPVRFLSSEWIRRLAQFDSGQVIDLDLAEHSTFCLGKTLVPFAEGLFVLSSLIGLFRCFSLATPLWISFFRNKQMYHVADAADYKWKVHTWNELYRPCICSLCLSEIGIPTLFTWFGWGLNPLDVCPWITFGLCHFRSFVVVESLNHKLSVSKYSWTWLLSYNFTVLIRGEAFSW